MLGEALEALEGAFVRAPFNGVVSQINVKIDDNIKKESRVIVVVDPTVVEVAGSVDAIDIPVVDMGAKAKVTISAVPGQVLDGMVTTIAAEPRTERGIVSYPVTIRVIVPEGVQVAAGLSAISAKIIP